MSKVIYIVLVFIVLMFSACGGTSSRVYDSYEHSKPQRYSPKSNQRSHKMDKKTYSHPTMKPYTIRGIRYYPTVVSVGDKFSGNASWYGDKFHGKLTSNGEKYNMYAMTAAHKTLPMNTIVKVTNLRNNLTAVVRINDRGPFIATRIIDLSNKAARKIDMIGAGTAPVRIEILGFQTKGKKQIPTKKELRYSSQKQTIGGFALQIASFKNINGALATQEKYNNTHGYKTIIKDMENENGRIFKVWLKGFKSEREARDYKAQGHFLNAFIVREY